MRRRDRTDRVSLLFSFPDRWMLKKTAKVNQVTSRFNSRFQQFW